MTLHAAASRCQSGALPMNPEKKTKKQQSKAVGFLSWEIKLVHTAHTEKGRVLVRSKGPNDHFSKQEGKENRTSRAAVWRNTGSVILS